MPVAMAEAVGDRPAPLLYQRHNLGEHTRGVFRMQQLGPALRVGRHLLWRVPHNRPKVLADEGAGIAIPRSLRRVDDFVGLTVSRYSKRWRALLSSVMVSPAPTSSNGSPASSRITLKASWIQMKCPSRCRKR